MIEKIFIALLVLPLVSCSSTMKAIPLEVAQQIPDSVEKVSIQNTKRLGYITDTSVAKEMIANNGYVQTLLGYFKAVEKAGTKIQMKQVTKSVSVGNQIVTWTEDAVDYVKHTPLPSTEWIRTLSKDPSIHPGWKTAENIFDTAFKFGTIMFGIDRFTGMVTSMTDTPTYSNSPIIQSQNVAGTTQDFVTDSQYQGSLEAQELVEGDANYSYSSDTDEQ